MAPPEPPHPLRTTLKSRCSDPPEAHAAEGGERHYRRNATFTRRVSTPDAARTASARNERPRASSRRPAPVNRTANFTVCPAAARLAPRATVVLPRTSVTTHL